jgi:hypothetical protein
LLAQVSEREDERERDGQLRQLINNKEEREARERGRASVQWRRHNNLLDRERDREIKGREREMSVRERREW